MKSQYQYRPTQVPNQPKSTNQRPSTAQPQKPSTAPTYQQPRQESRSSAQQPRPSEPQRPREPQKPSEPQRPSEPGKPAPGSTAQGPSPTHKPTSATNPDSSTTPPQDTPRRRAGQASYRDIEGENQKRRKKHQPPNQNQKRKKKRTKLITSSLEGSNHEGRSNDEVRASLRGRLSTSLGIHDTKSRQFLVNVYGSVECKYLRQVVRRDYNWCLEVILFKALYSRIVWALLSYVLCVTLYVLYVTF